MGSFSDTYLVTQTYTEPSRVIWSSELLWSCVDSEGELWRGIRHWDTQQAKKNISFCKFMTSLTTALFGPKYNTQGDKFGNDILWYSSYTLWTIVLFVQFDMNSFSSYDIYVDLVRLFFYYCDG